jgi:hypothetical protein
MLRTFPLLLCALLLLQSSQQKGCSKGGASSQGSASGGAAAGAAPGGEFDAAAEERRVRAEIDQLRLALESKMPRSVTSMFNSSATDAFPGLEDLMQNLAASASELRVFFRPANVQVRPAEGSGRPMRAQAQVDAEMVYTLKSAPGQEKRKTGQLLLDLEKNERGWQFVRIEPRSFFVP